MSKNVIAVETFLKQPAFQSMPLQWCYWIWNAYSESVYWGWAPGFDVIIKSTFDKLEEIGERRRINVFMSADEQLRKDD